MKKEKQERLLEQTVTYLLESKTFNMEGLATELGVVRKTLYNHFESREGLIRETIDYFFESNRNKMKEIIEEDLPYIKRGEMLLTHLGELIRSTERFCSHKEIRDSHVEEKYKESFVLIKQKISRFVEEGQEQGWIRSDTPLKAMAHLVFSLVLGSIHNREEEESYSSYLTLLIQGLAGEKARAIGITP
ncbi:MAG: TetR/AcrR family transcriptional regulator [Spirochaetales bacterium]|nr:TetR/AcrR family transcriptional regulator [Spirochaetales bacterium]